MNIKHNILYLLAVALTACSTDEIGSGGTDVVPAKDSTPLSFSTTVAPLSRSTTTGKDAAAALGNAFYVYAIKNEGSGTLDGNVVFNNYKVAYTDGSASTSNTSGWDYVGVENTGIGHLYGPDLDGNTTDSIATKKTTQTIKYWDQSATNYTFYAFADAGDDLKNDNINVTKVLTTAKADRYNNGYTIDIKENADPTKLYFASRQYIVPSTNTDTQADNVYNGKVKFTFCNAMANVRVGMYETIPGYSVTIDGFEVAEDNANPSFGDMTTQKIDKFYANLTNNTQGRAGTMTVTYSGTIKEEDKEMMPTTSESNQPSISFVSDSKNNLLILGDNLNGQKELAAADGTQASTAATAIFDKSDKSYTTLYPQGDNQNSLKLKVDFTLKSKIGETIKVKGATAEVPAEYLQWKPGYAYTYIFKISDQTNGVIGNLTGLYPITFDAVTVSDGAGKEEVISTTSQGKVNILTIGYNPTTQITTVGADDYNTGDEIYASVYDDTKTAELKTSNTKLYSVTTDDASNYPITAATVADYVTVATNNSSLINQHVTAWEEKGDIVSTVPGNNGTTYSISALKWTAENRVYAVEYTYSGTDKNTDKKTYKIVKVNGNNGLTKGTLTLDKTSIANVGGTIYPSLTVDGVAIANADVDYSLDYNGKAGQAVPETVKVEDNKTENVYITIPGSTKPTSDKAYYVTATYRGRTYTASFTVSQ